MTDQHTQKASEANYATNQSYKTIYHNQSFNVTGQAMNSFYKMSLCAQQQEKANMLSSATHSTIDY